jgi:hypothetical protein
MKMNLDMMHIILIVLLVVNLVFVIKIDSKLGNKGKGCSCMNSNNGVCNCNKGN